MIAISGLLRCYFPSCSLWPRYDWKIFAEPNHPRDWWGWSLRARAPV